MVDYNIKKEGMASIPTVIVLMILIMSVGALIASISISDNVSVSDTNNSGRALNYAQLGAKDALERIVRNKDYSGTYSIETVSGGCSNSFSGCATITVDSGSSPKIISVEGRVVEIKRKIQVDVNLDSNGLITGYTWNES
jgi:hypothetical protein